MRLSYINTAMIRDIRFTRLGDRAAGATASVPPPTASTPAAAAPAATTAADTSHAPPLQAFAGDYELAPGRTLAITLESGQLHGQPPGGGKRALTHVSGTTFSADGSQITLTFSLGADGRATAAVMRQGGSERTLPKVR